jgi:acyl-CoA reductase-like NAD-dependent aldehyde dehydrogenase
VHTSLYEEFKDTFVKLIESTYKYGDPMLDTTNLGPLAEPDELLSIQRKVDDAVS